MNFPTDIYSCVRFAGLSTGGNLIILSVLGKKDCYVYGSVNKMSDNVWISNNLKVYTPAEINFSKGLVKLTVEKRSFYMKNIQICSDSVQEIFDKFKV